MARGCTQRDCTVAQTGQCLLNNEPERCPKRSATDVPSGVSIAGATAPLPEREALATLPASQPLSAAQASELMESRYCRLIGILGSPDAGKTAAIVCLYLLLAHNRLRGYEFRDSRSLMALEEISRGARRWKEGDPPGDLTTHTEAKDERVAGFIHLRLQKTERAEPIDILFPDLPGEWSTALIDKNRTDRLSFLKSADAIWLIIDGAELTEATTHKVTVHRVALLLQRLKSLVGTSIPFYLVISRLDKGIPDGAYAPIFAEARRLSLSLSALQIASFSENTKVPPGTGIAELIDSISDGGPRPPKFWSTPTRSMPSRQILRMVGEEPGAPL